MVRATIPTLLSPLSRLPYPRPHVEKTGDASDSGTNVKEESRDDPTFDEEMLRKFKPPRGQAIVRCGTYGCILANNHRGLHCFPAGAEEGRASRKRSKPDDAQDANGGRSGSAAPSADIAAADDDADGEQVDDDDEAADSAAPPAPRKAQKGGGKPPASKPPAPEAARPTIYVAGLCKKIPFCQRLKNHPGAPLARSPGGVIHSTARARANAHATPRGPRARPSPRATCLPATACAFPPAD